VMLTARRPMSSSKRPPQLQSQGIDAQWIAADCAREDDIERLGAQTLERLGQIDILVNNAGATWGAPPRTTRCKPGTR